MEAQGRRQFLRNAFAASVALAAGASPLSRAFAASVKPDPLSRDVMRHGVEAFRTHSALITERRVMAIADFSVASATPRFHLLNMEDGASQALLVAHGKGSDPDHSGWVQNFSNVPGSLATSSGAYLVGESYIGKYGLSRRLVGLEPDNDQAEARAIVIHPAWYVSEDIAREQGKLGRSQGCFAFSQSDISQVLWQLPTGSLIYAGKA
jgi:L,D-transpeptidase catalytic domain